MEKFGYTISRPRVIDYDSNDRKVASYILERENSFRLCIECGGCSATCTTGKHTSFSLRELHILLKRGENEKPRDKLNECMLCGKCILVCPRGVNTRNVIFLAKEAFRKPDAHAI
ncbi:MAG TPA: 4Fe-4S dicluster domain-containing protein [Bacteroidales bacterium]|nr:4Fe-4S dicluster domain-containing protein [Bacteroidales bacterium]